MTRVGPIGFTGGWNTKASAWTMPINSLSDSQNIQLSYGDVVRRNGNTMLNGLALNGAVHGLFDWLANNGTRWLITTAGIKVYSCQSLNGSFTDITGSATVTAGQNNIHTFASLNNIVAICGGTTPDTPLQWVGSGNVASLAGSPPAGSIVAVANNFMFISGSTANPSRVQWSNVSDPNTWPSTSYIDFRASDGDSVTCLLELDQQLIIFKRRSVGLFGTQTQLVSGISTLGPLTEVVIGIGCPGPLCADNLPDGRVVFLGTDGHVYVLSGGRTPQDISNPQQGSNIQPTLDALNQARLPYACMKVYPTRNQVWISVSSTTNTTNDTILIYDYVYGVWVSKFININANVIEATIDSRSTVSHAILMVTGDYNGNVYEQDKGTTDASGTGGAIDGWGTVSVLHGIDNTDFIPRCVVVPFESQTSGSLTVGQGFNGLIDITKTTIVSMQQSGDQLDITFVLDTSVLQGASTQRKVLLLSGKGRDYSTQIQVRAQSPFTFHPLFLDDEVVI